MPGVPMVIGSHNHTIFLGRAEQYCTELDTKEETVSQLIERSSDRICAPACNKIISKPVWNKDWSQALGSPQEPSLACDLSQASNVKKNALADHPAQQKGYQGVENWNLSLQIS